MDPREDEKRAVAEAAAAKIEDGATVGLGTGSTVAHFLPALARRRLGLTCVATSPATEEAARSASWPVMTSTSAFASSLRRRSHTPMEC